MIQYKGCCEYSCVEDGTNNVTLEHPTGTFQDEINPSLKLAKITKLPSSKGIVQKKLGVIAMEIEDPPITNQKDQVPKVAILNTPLTIKVELGDGNEGNVYENRDVNYESEDLPLFSKKKGLPCVQTKNIAHSFKQGVVEYSNSREEGGMSNLQVVEVKRPRWSTPA